jgi:Flp pilus assembly protein TadG
MNTFKDRVRRHKRRGGVVTVESAMVIPLIFLSILAGVEFVRLNIIRHTIKNACYEAARAAIVPGAQRETAVGIADQILRISGIRDADVEIAPDPIGEDTTFVTATITVPIARNSWGISMIFAGNEMSASTQLRTERAPMVQAIAIDDLTRPEPPPVPEPTPDPEPTPVPEPTPDPEPTPVPEPTPDPEPTPEPAPSPPPVLL